MKRLWKNKIVLVILICAVMAVTCCSYIYRQKKKDNDTVVNIAVLPNNLVQNYNTNYYTKWLEEKTGYDIQFEYISEGYEKEYLSAMLSSKTGRIDGVFLPKGKELLTQEEFAQYTENGLIYNMREFVTEESNFYNILDKYEDISMRDQLAPQGGIYYMPNMDTSRKSQNMQVLWINMGWLKKLSLQIPESVEDFEEVLTAFRDGDPNGNGIQDELPLISSESSYALQSYNYLLNAFIYNDPYHMRMYAGEDGAPHSAAIQPAFREGLLYCAGLFQAGLLSDACAFFSDRQLQELINTPEDIVGAFTSQSIADVIYPNCADIMAKFIQVPPLWGTAKEQNAVMVDLEPQIGGYIPANGTHIKEAFEIMDLMMSPEAALIASYGEEGVDWKQSDSGDLSTYGSKAKITTLNYLKDTVQNKHFSGAGPLILSSEYANGVTWNGNNSLVEYIDARAVRSYENFYYDKKGLIQDINFIQRSASAEIQVFTDKWIYQFIFGKMDIRSDDVWEGYLNEREKLE